ncbi:hypothetical protein AWB71_05270 [Caballeronia peredens]|nr:hypothetical protein AWB71_05270 [Caballeronia peredens]
MKKKNWTLWCLFAGVFSVSLAGCGKSVPSASMDWVTFQHRFVRPLPPDWAKVMVTERHFKLSSQEMVGSAYAPIFFRTIEDCQANLRNYIAYKAQAESSSTGQTFIHAVSTDQYADKLPEIGPELVTLQCWDMSGSSATQAPAPDFPSAEKVAGKQSDASELPPKGPDPKPPTYLVQNEPSAAKSYDERFNEANRLEPGSHALGLTMYDLETQKAVRAGKTPYEFEDLTSCRQGISGFITYMAPIMKGMPTRFVPVGLYNRRTTTPQYMGRDPQSGKVMLLVPACVMKTADGKFAEDPKFGMPQPAFDMAQTMIDHGDLKQR